VRPRDRQRVVDDVDELLPQAGCVGRWGGGGGVDELVSEAGCVATAPPCGTDGAPGAANCSPPLLLPSPCAGTRRWTAWMSDADNVGGYVTQYDPPARAHSPSPPSGARATWCVAGSGACCERMPHLPTLRLPSVSQVPQTQPAAAYKLFVTQLTGWKLDHVSLQNCRVLMRSPAPSLLGLGSVLSSDCTMHAPT